MLCQLSRNTGLPLYWPYLKYFCLRKLPCVCFWPHRPRRCHAHLERAFLAESCCQACYKVCQPSNQAALPVLLSVCVCVGCQPSSQQHSQHWSTQALGSYKYRVASASSGAAPCRLCHRVCLVIAALISLAAPELTGRGLEESGRVKRENATCLQ